MRTGYEDTWVAACKSPCLFWCGNIQNRKTLYSENLCSMKLESLRILISNPFKFLVCLSTDMNLLYSVVEVMIFFKLSAKPTSVSKWFVGKIKQKKTRRAEGGSLRPLPLTVRVLGG